MQGTIEAERYIREDIGSFATLAKDEEKNTDKLWNILCYFLHWKLQYNRYCYTVLLSRVFYSYTFVVPLHSGVT
jgi:hypothetical protein